MNKKYIILLILITVISVTGCTSASRATTENEITFAQQGPIDSGQDDPNPIASGDSSVITSSNAVESPLKEFEVELPHTIATLPSINANLGDTVRLMFMNHGGFTTLEIAQFHVDYPLTQDGMNMIDFLADTRGTFEYTATNNVSNLKVKGTITIK